MTEGAQLPNEMVATLLTRLSRRRLAEGGVAEVFREALRPEAPGTLTDPELAPAAYQLFHRLCGNLSHFEWARLAAAPGGCDRERAVWRVWSYLETHCGEQVEENIGSLAYHRSWLFAWFRNRYDLRRARRALGGGRLVQNLHLLLLAAVLAVAWLRWGGLLDGAATQRSLLGLAMVYLAAVLWIAAAARRRIQHHSEALALAQQSLIPRLAAAGLGGVVILASSQELLRLIVQRASWGWLIGLLAAGYIYLLVEMSQRVHPLPRRGSLFLRGFDLWCLALTHSLALALIAESALGLVLDPTAGVAFTVEQSAAITVFIFAIGLVVNLIWAEQPVTDPL